MSPPPQRPTGGSAARLGSGDVAGPLAALDSDQATAAFGRAAVRVHVAHVAAGHVQRPRRRRRMASTRPPGTLLAERPDWQAWRRLAPTRCRCFCAQPSRWTARRPASVAGAGRRPAARRERHDSVRRRRTRRGPARPASRAEVVPAGHRRPRRCAGRRVSGHGPDCGPANEVRRTFAAVPSHYPPGRPLLGCVGDDELLRPARVSHERRTKCAECGAPPP